MGEKEELKHFFTCNGKVIETIPEISISDGTVIEGGIFTEMRTVHFVA